MAKAGSMTARVTAWKARSQAANQGYSQLSGIDRMSLLLSSRQSALRPAQPAGRRRIGRISVEPLVHVVVIELLAPDQPGEGLSLDEALVGAQVLAAEVGVEVVGLGDPGRQRQRRSR